jgi:16S rRNA (uracil1498-N3)-methyltransferase
LDKDTLAICRYSERKIIKAERIEKIIVSAAKQSLKAYLPRLNPLITISELLKTTDESTARFIAHCRDEQKTEFRNSLKNQNNIMLLIGPEGDFSEEEVNSALAAGFTPVSLGEFRLRTETAGVVGCVLAGFCR